MIRLSVCHILRQGSLLEVPLPEVLRQVQARLEVVVPLLRAQRQESQPVGEQALPLWAPLPCSENTPFLQQRGLE